MLLNQPKVFLLRSMTDSHDGGMSRVEVLRIFCSHVYRGTQLTSTDGTIMMKPCTVSQQVGSNIGQIHYLLGEGGDYLYKDFTPNTYPNNRTNPDYSEGAYAFNGSSSILPMLLVDASWRSFMALETGGVKYGDMISEFIGAPIMVIDRGKANTLVGGYSTILHADGGPNYNMEFFTSDYGSPSVGAYGSSGSSGAACYAIETGMFFKSSDDSDDFYGLPEGVEFAGAFTHGFLLHTRSEGGTIDVATQNYRMTGNGAFAWRSHFDLSAAFTAASTLGLVKEADTQDMDDIYLRS